MLVPAALVLALFAAAPAQRRAPTPPRPAAAPARPPSRPNPVTALDDLNAAVVPPSAGSLEDTPASVRDHEERTAAALDPARTADDRAAGAGCGQDGGLLRCATNQDVANRPANTPDRAPQPNTDLMGRPR